MPRASRPVRAMAIALIAGLTGLGPADAEPRRAGVVTALQGTALLTRATLPAPRALAFRDAIHLADRITTGEESLARILLGGRAVVTVRERSVVTITEAPGVSRVDVAVGRVAVAVARERMRPGDRIELRTPNAVAGIRGTVVVAEVTRTAADVATRITLLSGVIDVLRLDPARRPVGRAIVMTPLQAVDVVGGALSPVRPITRDEGRAVSGSFRAPVATSPRRGPDWVARDQVDEAVARLRRFERGPGADHRADTRADRRDRPDPRDGHDGGDRLERADLDDLADRSGRHARRHRRDREDRSLVRPPTTPLVPPSAMQPSARDRDDKGHKKR